ncbi:MAG TPA: glycosyltransferase family 2 protein [Anaeromyxobacteraceae bacterium]|nr:glycosyltransferase family 2 protein [Anaeromyxobacteraceae bacterium]
MSRGGDAGDQALGSADAGLELSIVMPCLDEAETVGACVREARAFLAASGVRGEVLVGDNGSSDGSQEIARREGARVVDVPVRGYGAALHAAVLAARGRYVVMGDSDRSYDFSDLTPFLERLRQGFDLVMGNRFLGGIERGAMPWKNRHVGNPALSGIGRLLFGCPARDLHCGIRGFSAEAFRRMDLRTTGMEFASEMVVKATLLGMRVTEVPARLRRDGRSGPPHLRPWQDGWRHLRFMLLYSPNWLFFYPGLALAAAGLLVGAWLLPGPRRIGGVELDVHTLLYAALAVLVGVQAIGFAIFSKTFAAAEGLLPESRRQRAFHRRVTLEVGIGAGVLLAAAGLAGSVHAVLRWRAGSFGPLDPARTLREVIPSVLATVLGIQVLLSSFFLSVLRLKRRPLDDGPGEAPR